MEGPGEGRAMGGPKGAFHLAELPCSFSGPAQGRVWAWTKRIPPALSLLPWPETRLHSEAITGWRGDR